MDRWNTGLPHYIIIETSWGIVVILWNFHVILCYIGEVQILDQNFGFLSELYPLILT